jgi:hypothetical protein
MTETLINDDLALVNGDVGLTETTITTSAYTLAVTITAIADLNLASGVERPQVWVYAVSMPDVGTFNATTKAQIRQTASDQELAVRCFIPETSGLIRTTIFPLAVATGTRLYSWVECSKVTSSTLTADITLVTV